MSLNNLIYQGATKEVKLSSGKILTIRENNGEDESILSEMKNVLTGKNTTDYLVRILSENTPPLTEKDVDELFEIDRQGLLFHARLLSLGNTFILDHECQNQDCKKPFKWTEDLSEYITGPTEDRTPEELPWLNAQVIPTLPLGEKTEYEIVLSSGKRVKLKILTGSLQKKKLANPDSLNINTKLLYRELSLQNPQGIWEVSTHFSMYSSKDLMEIRAAQQKNDPVWNPLSKNICPHCKQENVIEIMGNPSFFFPSEI